MTAHQDDILASGSRNAASLTTNEAEKSVLTNVSFSPVAQTPHGYHPRTAEAHDSDSLTDSSPSQPDTKTCIQVGRETYALTSQPGTSYTSQDYDSISVIDSSSPSAHAHPENKKRLGRRVRKKLNKNTPHSTGTP